jgi:autoinducer 2-degrading protein
MIIALVHIHVKPEMLDAFREITLENVRNSLLEPGVIRFDFIRQESDPTRFVLIEVFRSSEAQAAHRETAHYKTWRERAEPMMAEPRTGIRYTPVFPAPEAWERPDARSV